MYPLTHTERPCPLRVHICDLSSHSCSFIMGLKFSRKRDAAANGAEAAEEAAAPRPEGAEGQPGTPQRYKADDKEDLDVVVGKPASPVATLPSEDCVWECKEATEGGEAGSKDTPPPEAATGAQVVPPEPEPTVTPVDLPGDPEPASEAQSVKDAVAIETPPGPEMPSPGLGDAGDPAPGPDATPASPPDGESHDVCGETAEAAEELMEAEPAGSSRQVGEDADEASVDKLLENLDLTGSDLTTDVVPTETCGDTST